MRSPFNHSSRLHRWIAGASRPGQRFVLTVCLAGLIAILLVVSRTDATDNKKGDRSSHARTLGDYRRDLKAFMKHSKRDDQPAIQRAAIYNLCELHCTIVRDPRFGSSQSLQGMRVVAANRLKEFANNIKKEHLRLSRKSSHSRIASEMDFTRIATTEQSAIKPKPAANDMLDATARSYRLMSSIGGGPNRVFSYAGGRFAPPWDHGPELVDLIENTINPAFWRRNGGTGVIHYYQPLRVLVIGASTQVHEDTLELLQKFRR